MTPLRRLALIAMALLTLGAAPLAAQSGQHRIYLPQLSGQPITVAQLDGAWSGTTDQGRPFSFTVAGGKLTSLSYAYQIGGCGADATVTFGVPLAIAGQAFRFSQSIFGQPSIAISGVFGTAQHASGTLQVSNTVCGSVSVTWTAAKGAPVTPTTPTITHTPTNTRTPTATPTRTSTTTPTQTSTQGPGVVFDGYWGGTTSEGLPFSFEILGGGLKKLSFAFAAASCGISRSNITTTYVNPQPLGPGGEFSANGNIPGLTAISYTVSGAISGPQAAAGTLNIIVQGFFPGPTCRQTINLTWTAAPAEPPTPTPTRTASPTRTQTTTATPTDTVTATPTTSPSLTAQVRLINDTPGALSYVLSGPTDLSGSVPTGQTRTLDVAPGSYSLTATASCGTRSDVFSVDDDEIQEYTYYCTVNGAAPDLVAD